MYVRNIGSLPKEPFSGSTNVTHTFAQPVSGFGITNDGIANLTFTIGSDTFTLKSGETWEYPLPSFTSVAIATTVDFRAWGLI